GRSPAKTKLGGDFLPSTPHDIPRTACASAGIDAYPPLILGGIDAALTPGLSALCAAILVPVLLRPQRQLSEERTRPADPLQNRRGDGRGTGDVGGRRFRRAVLSIVGDRRRTRRSLR